MKYQYMYFLRNKDFIFFLECDNLGTTNPFQSNIFSGYSDLDVERSKGESVNDLARKQKLKGFIPKITFLKATSEITL